MGMNGFERSGVSGSFLPAEYVQGRSAARANILALLLFGAVMVAVVSAFFVTNQRWQDVRAEQRAIRAEYETEAVKIEALRSLEEQRQQIVEKAEIVTALVDSVPRSVLLAELRRGKPTELTLERIRLTGERVRVETPKAEPKSGKRSLSSRTKSNQKEEKTEPAKVPPPRFTYAVEVVGVASLNNDVADYLEAMKNSPLFRNVELQFITEQRVDGVELRKFRITMGLDPAADARLVRGVIETDLSAEPAIEFSSVNESAEVSQ